MPTARSPLLAQSPGTEGPGWQHLDSSPSLVGNQLLLTLIATYLFRRRFVESHFERQTFPYHAYRAPSQKNPSPSGWAVRKDASKRVHCDSEKKHNTAALYSFGEWRIQTVVEIFILACFLSAKTTFNRFLFCFAMDAIVRDYNSIMKERSGAKENQL